MVAAFEKQKTTAEIAEILKTLYHGGNGLGSVSAWYAEDGIHLSHGKSVRYDRSAQVISWESAAERIGELLESGQFASNVELAEAAGYMLVERKKEIDELMDLFGDEYIDNNLVFCSSNGRPMESQVINRAFNKLIKENGLPHVVFHSLRHSSITYKLKLNGGDMKSVQGDSGHAQVKMVADVYSHIIDEDRCINAQRLEEAFYSSKTPDPVEDTEPKTADTAVTESDESDAAKILELLKNPETAALLKQLAKAL